MAKGIEALGVNIIGDISALGTLPEDLPEAADNAPAVPLVPVEAAVRAALGAFMAGGADGRTSEEIVREVDTRDLAKVLAKRGRQRLLKALPR
jgi:hypothetical protein